MQPYKPIHSAGAVRHPPTKPIITKFKKLALISKQVPNHLNWMETVSISIDVYANSCWVSWTVDPPGALLAQSPAVGLVVLQRRPFRHHSFSSIFIKSIENFRNAIQWNVVHGSVVQPTLSPPVHRPWLASMQELVTIRIRWSEVIRFVHAIVKCIWKYNNCNRITSQFIGI